jgi:ABC transport system ATP-binding/permease protein
MIDSSEAGPGRGREALSIEPEAYLEVGPSRVALPRRPRLSLGRGAACDVVLDGDGVAAVHAHLELVGGAHRVVAQGGALITIGDAAAPVGSAMLHDGDVVRFASLAAVYRNPLAAQIGKVHHFATPPGTTVRTIGRADSDIVLAQPLVSRHHAELRWEHGRHVLRDLDSANGTFVNGEKLHAARVLAPGDVVQIGTFQLTYDGDSLDSFDQRGAVRIDAAAVEVRVGDRQLLAPTTISIEPCEFVAIVGGSGAGKSTLMMALCGFARATHGRVTLNGDDLYAGYDAYRSIIGYVPQDDILHRTLTVRRALAHAARLRLPTDTTPPEIEARVAAVLDEVEMFDHADKRIDQLSGGQRKRVSIACELLADPVLLFLDEPTSGLDPGLERKLMFTLRKLADGGRTIVLITHATQNIAICDHLAFLACGRMTYFGPPSQALGFFAAGELADIYAFTEDEADAARWAETYRGSLQHQKYLVERPARAPAKVSSEQRAANAERAETFEKSRGRQLAILVRRYVELVVSDRRNLALLLLQAPVIGLLLVLVTRDDAFTQGRIEAKKLTFMLATTGVWFGVINAAREICKEAAVLRRERLAGLRAGPYVGSKLVVLFALVLVQSALLVGCVALRVQPPAAGILLPPWLELYVTVALAGLGGIALGLCVSAVAATPDKATSLIPIVLVPQVLLCGVMFALRGVTDVASYACSARAAVDGLSATVDTNALGSPMPMLALGDEAQYAHTPAVLLRAWGTLVAQGAVFAGAAWLVVRRRRR